MRAKLWVIEASRTWGRKLESVWRCPDSGSSCPVTSTTWGIWGHPAQPQSLWSRSSLSVASVKMSSKEIRWRRDILQECMTKKIKETTLKKQSDCSWWGVRGRGGDCEGWRGIYQVREEAGGRASRAAEAEPGEARNKADSRRRSMKRTGCHEGSWGCQWVPGWGLACGQPSSHTEVWWGTPGGPQPAAHTPGSDWPLVQVFQPHRHFWFSPGEDPASLWLRN